VGSVLAGGGQAATLAQAVITLGVAIGGPVLIARDLIKHPTVTVQSVLAGIDIYLLFGLLFVVAYAVVEAFAPSPLFVGVEAVSAIKIIYYSFATLTGLGANGLIPTDDITRMLTILEVIIGQLYLITVLAVLIGRMGAVRAEAARDTER